MAILHVAAGGSNTAPYETWAKAASTLAVAAGAAAAGDTIWFDSSYTDSAAGQSISFASSLPSAPVRVISGTPAATASVTAIVSGGTVTTTNTTFTCTGDAYINGITFQASSTSSTDMKFNSSTSRTQMHENCTYYVSSATPTGTRVIFGYDSTSTGHPNTVLKNPTFRFTNASQKVGVNSHLYIYGGSLHASGTDPSTMFDLGYGSRGGRLVCSGFDFSNGSSSMNLAQPNTACSATFRNCKLPTSWSGAPGATPPGGNGSYYELLNYGINGVTGSNYRFWTVSSFGSNKDDATIYRTGGAQDEVTPYSIKMSTSTAVAPVSHVLRSTPIITRVPAAVGGVPDTVTVHCTHDRATAFTDQEVWLEVEVLGTTDYPLATFSSDQVALLTGLTGTGTAQTTSSESWTGTGGFSNAKKIQLSVSSLVFSNSGYVICTVCMAVPSETLYVCPKVTVS